MLGLCQCIKFEEALSDAEKKESAVFISKIIVSILPLCMKNGSVDVPKKRGKGDCNEYQTVL